MWGTEPLWQHLAAPERGECQDTPGLPGIPAQGVNCPSFTTVMNFREAEKFVQGHPVHPSGTRSPCPAHWQCCSRTWWAPSCQGWASWGIWCVTEGRGAPACLCQQGGQGRRVPLGPAAPSWPAVRWTAGLGASWKALALQCCHCAQEVPSPTPPGSVSLSSMQPIVTVMGSGTSPSPAVASVSFGCFQHHPLSISVCPCCCSAGLE